MSFIRKNFFLIMLIFICGGVFLVNARINIFRYNNFDYGKFDLGNMVQMEWNTLNGRFMYLTDYFGTNLPRWAMSHVDPILLIFLPPFIIYPHSLTLVFSQIILVLFSAIIIYKLAELELNSKLAGFLLGVSFLLYPAVGFLTAWTGFHGVTAAIPFFLLAFYTFEVMYKRNDFSKRNLILFWVFLVITMSGKEQLSLYIFLYGFFIWLFRGQKKLGLKVSIVGLVWFILCFFVIIPAFAHYRIEGFQRFEESLGLDSAQIRDVENSNYFLSRYEAFGDSYVEIGFNMLIHPNDTFKVFFGGDKIENLRKTFEPLGYLPLAFPGILILALPDFMANYLTTAGGIGTAEIYNHRISMIVPVLFLSVIYGIGFLRNVYPKKLKPYFVTLLLCAFVLGTNLYTTFKYENPVYLWLTQALTKRLFSSIAFAKTNIEVANNQDLKFGEVLRLSKLENKDRECAEKIVNLIPEAASVSGPDYLGAHLAQRETYAIFPALYNQADYVIVDVFSKKILNILDVDLNLIHDVVGELVKDPNYKLETGCGNLFVFRNVGPHGKESLLPLQEFFEYPEKINNEIFQSLSLVDYNMPTEIMRGENTPARFVYIKRNNNSLDEYVLFMTFINKRTGELYQAANLPSFGLTELRNWREDRYYEEKLDLALPKYLEAGEYQAFIGISNNVRTRSIYLGDVKVL